MRLQSTGFATLHLLFLISALARADEIADAAPAADGGSERPEIAETRAGDAMRLSLEEAIELALVNNLDVQVQRFGPLLGAEQQTEAWGAFDPELFAEFGYTEFNDPNTFNIDASTTISRWTTDGFGGFRGVLPFLSSEYDFRFDSSRVSTNSTVQALSPELRSSFSLNLTQPLLRGLIWNEPWTRVKTTRALYDQSLEDFRRQVMDTIQQVEDGYWNLIATEEQKLVAEKSLETARALLDQTETQFEVGVVSKVEVVEAEAGVAERDVALIRAENFYLSAQDRLLNLIIGTQFAADSTVVIEPTDRPEDYVTYEIDAELATQRAFEHRPELEIADDEIAQREFELKFAKRERLPELDIQLSYGNRGVAGPQNEKARCSFNPDPTCPTDPLTKIPSTPYGNTVDNFFTGNAADQWSARALFSIPLPNTAPRARVAQSDLALRRTKTEKQRLEQTIILEVRKAVRDLRSAQQGIEAAGRATAAAAEQLRAERIRLEYGESTPFDVLLREEDFVEAKSIEIDALKLYRTSVTGLDRAQGTILVSRNIRIDTVRALR